MPLDQLLVDMWVKVLPYLILMCVAAGFVGAMICTLFTSVIEDIEAPFLRKAKAKRWAKAQAEKEARSCGDDAAGRACETGGGSSA